MNESERYSWTLPVVMLDHRMVPTILLQILSLEFMYNHWFSVIQPVSTGKEKLNVCPIYYDMHHFNICLQF